MTTPENKFHDGTQVYFNLKNSSLVAQEGENNPQGFYIKGEINNNMFVPSGNILGQGELAKENGRYGWLELNSKKFFPMESSQKAQTPFVKGYQRDDGFYPSDRDVFNTP